MDAENLLLVTRTVTVGIVFALFAFVRTIAFRVTKGVKREELATRFTKPNPSSSSTLKRLSELEKNVDILQSKLNAMPSEKEELLNAAVYRVDALEAELIATKKVTVFHFKSNYISCRFFCHVIVKNFFNFRCVHDVRKIVQKIVMII
jgi:hypothetical protein